MHRTAMPACILLVLHFLVEYVVQVVSDTDNLYAEIPKLQLSRRLRHIIKEERISIVGFAYETPIVIVDVDCFLSRFVLIERSEITGKPHGEMELCASMRTAVEREFERKCSMLEWNPTVPDAFPCWSPIYTGALLRNWNGSSRHLC